MLSVISKRHIICLLFPPAHCQTYIFENSFVVKQTVHGVSILEYLETF